MFGGEAVHNLSLSRRVCGADAIRPASGQRVDLSLPPRPTVSASTRRRRRGIGSARADVRFQDRKATTKTIGCRSSIRQTPASCCLRSRSTAAAGRRRHPRSSTPEASFADLRDPTRRARSRAGERRRIDSPGVTCLAIAKHRPHRARVRSVIIPSANGHRRDLTWSGHLATGSARRPSPSAVPSWVIASPAARTLRAVHRQGPDVARSIETRRLRAARGPLRRVHACLAR